MCEKRRLIIASSGHILVLGGPGCGKTTIALLKAKSKVDLLHTEQQVLFLSFSRAAVQQIADRSKNLLALRERNRIRIDTYHAFCFDILRSFGHLLTRKPIKVLFPDQERILKSHHTGDWIKEQKRLREEEGYFCFDEFASGVADLFERSKSVRKLIASCYPIVIVDEFQDTDDDQWRFVQALSRYCDVSFLADPDQRIFEYRAKVNPKRIKILKDALNPIVFDFSNENHRSPAAGILNFANAVLNNETLPETNDVQFLYYHGKNFDCTVHAAVIWLLSHLRKKGNDNPSIAVLSRTNALVARCSSILDQEHRYRNCDLKPVEHDVLWDAEMSAAAALVVASILEWSSGNTQDVILVTLDQIEHYYRLKNAEKVTKKVTDMIRKIGESMSAINESKKPRFKAAKLLIEAVDKGISLTGDSSQDWLIARSVIRDINTLSDLFKDSKTIRLFRATDALGSGLASLWLDQGSYKEAINSVRRILERERLIAAKRGARGCVLMNMHKSKGKEFDGVILVEGEFAGKFFNDQREEPPFERSRRLLRVAVTRARLLATFVRPYVSFR